MTDNFCFECGTALRPNAKFCSSCGISLAEDAVENTPTPAPAPTPAVTPTPTPTPAPEPTEETERDWSVAAQPLWWHLLFGISGAFLLGFIAASNGANAGGFGILGFLVGNGLGWVTWQLVRSMNNSDKKLYEYTFPFTPNNTGVELDPMLLLLGGGLGVILLLILLAAVANN